MDTIRRTLPSLSYFEEFFHRKILFKIGLICFNYLAPVDWINCLRTLTQLTKLAIDTLKSQTSDNINDNDDYKITGMDLVSAYRNFQDFLSKSYVYSPKSIDEDCILALMVHQRLCQLILQQSTKHTQRRRKDAFRKQHNYESQQRKKREQEYQEHISNMKEKMKGRQINDINYDQESTDSKYDRDNRDSAFNYNKRQSSPLITVIPTTDEQKQMTGIDLLDDSKSKHTNDSGINDDASDVNSEETDLLISKNGVANIDNDANTGTNTNNNSNDNSGKEIGISGIGAGSVNNSVVTSGNGGSGAVGANNLNLSNLSLNQMDLDPRRNSASSSILAPSVTNANRLAGLLLHDRLIGAGYNEYILSTDEQSEIERESETSLLFLTILLSERREYLSLSRLLLRSVNESQIDCSRWYKYGISLFGNGLFEDSMRACWHCLQNDTVVLENSFLFEFFTFSNKYNGKTLKQQINAIKMRQNRKEQETHLLRHHFCLSACVLASKCAYLMDDSKTALNYARAAVRLSLDKDYIPKCSTSVILVDQRQTAYLMFSIACTQEAYLSLVQG